MLDDYEQYLDRVGFESIFAHAPGQSALLFAVCHYFQGLRVEYILHIFSLAQHMLEVKVQQCALFEASVHLLENQALWTFVTAWLHCTDLTRLFGILLSSSRVSVQSPLHDYSLISGVFSPCS